MYRTPQTDRYHKQAAYKRQDRAHLIAGWAVVGVLLTISAVVILLMIKGQQPNPHDPTQQWLDCIQRQITHPYLNCGPGPK